MYVFRGIAYCKKCNRTTKTTATARKIRTSDAYNHLLRRTHFIHLIQWSEAMPWNTHYGIYRAWSPLRVGMDKLYCRIDCKFYYGQVNEKAIMSDDYESSQGSNHQKDILLHYSLCPFPAKKVRIKEKQTKGNNRVVFLNLIVIGLTWSI